MVVELRRYKLWPGRIPDYLERYGAAGYSAQSAVLGPALGWFVTDVGVQNEVTQIWCYDSFGELETRRNRLANDPGWIAVRDEFRGIFAEQETQLLKPVEGLALTAVAETPGLVDIRVYTLRHGEIDRFLELFRERGAAIQSRHWPDNVGYFQVVSGPQNRIVHIWGHDDHFQRLERRRTLMADPEWRAYLAKVLPLFVSMKSSTAMPTAFWRRK